MEKGLLVNGSVWPLPETCVAVSNFVAKTVLSGVFVH